MVREPCGLTYRQLQDLSDEDLMLHLRGRHDDALAILVSRYERLVWSVAHKIVRDQGEAEDLVQTTFLELFRCVELFDQSRGTLRVWLLQLAYARSINRLYHLRRRQFYSQVAVDDEEEGRVLVSPGATSFRMSSSETARLVREGLQSLKDEQRTAIEAISFEGLTFDELANRTGETLANAKHHYYRGMMKLRELIVEPAADPRQSKQRRNDRQEGLDGRAQSV